MTFPNCKIGKVHSPKGSAQEHRETKPEQVADLLLDSKEVMIVPGYGMAVSQATQFGSGSKGD